MNQVPEGKQLDWGELFKAHLTDQGITAVSPEMAGFMQSKDSFLPSAIGQFAEKDLEKLNKISDLVGKEAERVSYYLFYKQLIDKILVLVAEQFPDKFKEMPVTLKDRAFGAKINLPDENSVLSRLYVYLMGTVPLPPGTLFQGVGLRDLLIRLSTQTPDVIDQRLVDLLCEVDNQYRDYFETADYL
jgi:hypothetical protein